MSQGLLRRAALGTAAAADLALCLPVQAPAAQRTLATGGGVTTSLPGQRNLIYVAGWGYWSFHKDVNSDRAVYRFSVDGQTWNAPVDVMPFSLLAPDASAGNMSVWHRTDTNEVYVAAPDANIDINGTGLTSGNVQNIASGNKVFIRRGTLNSTGVITWAAEGIRRQRMTLGANRGTCQMNDGGSNGVGVWDPIALKSVTIAYSSSTTGESVIA